MQKQRLAIILLLALISCPCLLAQKKELSQARTYIKSGKDFDKAEKLMTDLLARDSASRSNERVYQTWYDAVRGQYDAANERLYLKQKQDTAAFFALASRMFTILEALDSVEVTHLRKSDGHVPSRQKNAQILHLLRPNLFNAGIFHIRKSQWKDAFGFLEQYLDCARQPLFSQQDYNTNDPRMAEAAYWSCYAAYRMNDAVRTLRYRTIALQDTTKARFTLQYIAEARRWLGDEELYCKTLEEGFTRYPLSPYFFPRLIDFYNQRGDYSHSLSVAESAIEACDTCVLFLFAKSSALLGLKRFNESIDYSDRVLRLCDTLPEPYYNAGTAWMNKALLLSPQNDKKQIRTCYQQARSYMEKYRQLAPDQKNKWGPALYRIYLNLNLGRQFDEIDRLLKGK